MCSVTQLRCRTKEFLNFILDTVMKHLPWHIIQPSTCCLVSCLRVDNCSIHIQWQNFGWRVVRCRHAVTRAGTVTWNIGNSDQGLCINIDPYPLQACTTTSRLTWRCSSAPLLSIIQANVVLQASGCFTSPTVSRYSDTNCSMCAGKRREEENGEIIY